jgi:uncharacterized protein
MNALILMTRLPIPGKTKTRLMEILTGEECAQLHRCFIIDMFNVIGKFKKTTDVYITYTPSNCLEIIEDIIPKFVVSFPQLGDNLGARMHNAISRGLKAGYSKVILIGSDIPCVQPSDIKKAFEILDVNDICLGPTNDGGYYLIGMKKPHEKIFNDTLKWGNKSVLEQTVSIANSLELTVGFTSKLSDIDDKNDIEAFIEEVSREDKFNGKIHPQNTIDFIWNRWRNMTNDERYIR